MRWDETREEASAQAIAFIKISTEPLHQTII